MTPLIELTQIASKYRVEGQIIIKDKGRLPTGSFKACGLAMAVSMAKELGVKNSRFQCLQMAKPDQCLPSTVLEPELKLLSFAQMIHPNVTLTRLLYREQDCAKSIV
jgi:hypothetical protein